MMCRRFLQQLFFLSYHIRYVISIVFSKKTEKNETYFFYAKDTKKTCKSLKNVIRFFCILRNL